MIVAARDPGTRRGPVRSPERPLTKTVVLQQCDLVQHRDPAPLAMIVAARGPGERPGLARSPERPMHKIVVFQKCNLVQHLPATTQRLGSELV